LDDWFGSDALFLLRGSVERLGWFLSTVALLVSFNRCTDGFFQPLHWWFLSTVALLVSFNRCTGGFFQPL